MKLEKEENGTDEAGENEEGNDIEQEEAETGAIQNSIYKYTEQFPSMLFYEMTN